MARQRHEFSWDERKEAANRLKHGITFELAASVFDDPSLMTTADLAHSETEERWFSVGVAANGQLISVVYVWSEKSSGAAHPVTGIQVTGIQVIGIRLISARKATTREIRYYQEGS